MGNCFFFCWGFIYIYITPLSGVITLPKAGFRGPSWPKPTSLSEIPILEVKNGDARELVGFSPTHLKNMKVKLDHFHRDRGENKHIKKCLKPPP